MADDDLDDLIHAADLDGLVRMIDDRCSTGDWDGLLRVRDRARSAVKTGRQLWPAATLAEYRLALLAPPHHVAAVLDETDGLSGQFTIGPLTEVAAQHHTWDALRTELNPSPRAAFVAHERAIRGEVVDDDIADVLDIPLELEGWEPTYAVAKYRDNDADFPAPRLPTNWEEIETSSEAERLDDDVELAVQQLVEPWLSGSNGTVEVVCVEGDVGDAIGALGPHRARVCELDVRTAMAWMAWAGASGGLWRGHMVVDRQHTAGSWKRATVCQGGKSNNYGHRWTQPPDGREAGAVRDRGLRGLLALKSWMYV